MANDAKRVISFSKMKTADQLADKRRELETLRTNDVREWAQNRAFYKGNQWCFWNNVSGQVETLPVAEGDKPRWKVRLTSNQILPGVQHYVAQLTKTKPVIEATPDSTAYRDISAAEVAESLFEYWWQELLLKSKLQRALINACISQGYWKISWDALAGKSMKIMLGPDGQPIMNEDLADAFRDELRQVAEQNQMDEQQLLQMFEKTIYVGDLRVDVMPGENVIIDPAATTYTEAAYAICRHALDVDEIKARWGKDMEPNSAPTDSAVPLAFSKSKEQRSKTVRDVYIGYFKPSASIPKGRYVVWTEEPYAILEDTDWPYPFNELPLVKFPGIERDDSATDEALVTHARPLQKELNRTLSQIVQFKDLSIKPQMIAPVGSLRQRLTDEPGAVFEYQPIQGLAPEWRQPPQLPQAAFNILGDIQQRLDRLFNRIPSQRDSMPARVDSGISVELLQEAVADQISPVINRMEEALARAGYLMVLLAQKYYIEPRLLKIRGEGGSTQVRKFRNADLAGGFSITAQSGSGLPRSRAGRQQQILELVDRQMLSPQQALKRLDLADMRSIGAAFAADEDQAHREHDKLIRQQPINALAVQGAMMEVNQALMSGEIDEMQAQQILMQAALSPLPYENSAAHASVHALFMKSPEFEQLPPEAQQAFNMHYMLTQQALAAAAPVDPKALPKSTVNMRATVSAPVMQKILEKQGIMTTEEEIEELPLETAVYDSVDKPDIDEAGNDPLTAQETQQYQSDKEKENARKAKADADFSERRAKETSFKPKPTAK